MNKKQISTKTLKDFGILIGFGFPVIIGLLIPILTGHSFRAWTLLIGITSLLFSCFYPNSLYFPYKLWMKLGHVLGWINSRIILAIVFFLVLLPISIVMKLFGYDPLKQNKSSAKTYKIDTKNRIIDLKRIF